MYRISGDGWQIVDRLEPAGNQVLFGGRVAVDGDVAAVAATFFGSTAVFERRPTQMG